MNRLVTLIGLAASMAPGWAGDDVLLRALSDEMERSMKELRLPDLEGPYFISYRVDETTHDTVSATLGSLETSSRTRYRSLTVELRVGSYELDNTNFLSFPSYGASMMSWAGTGQLPLDADYQELRRQIWLATDNAYKTAVEQLAQKKAALQHRTRTDEIPTSRRPSRSR